MNKLSTVLLSLIAIPASAQHIIDPTFPTRPAAPTALNPNAVTNASSRALRWRQGGFYATRPQPSEARYLHICIYDALHGQTCSSTANQWLYAASDAALQRTAVIPPFNPPPITSTYAYTFQPPANAVPLDRSLRWNVGACSSQALTSCNYASAPTLHLSTKNIVAVNIDQEIGNDRLTVTPIVRNAGTTDSGVISVHMWIREAFYDSSGTCAISASSDGVEPGDIAVTASGQEIRLLSSDVPGTVAIYRRWSAPEYDGYASLSVAAGATAAGMTIDHAPAAPLPAAYLIVMRADIPEALVEYDETDNVRAECHVIFP